MKNQNHIALAIDLSENCFGVPYNVFKGRSRRQHLADTRFAVALILLDKGFTTFQVGAGLGRDRTTASYIKTKIRARLEQDTLLGELYRQAQEHITKEIK